MPRTFCTWPRVPEQICRSKILLFKWLFQCHWHVQFQTQSVLVIDLERVEVDCRPIGELLRSEASTDKRTAFYSRWEWGGLPHKWASGRKIPLPETTTLDDISKFCIKFGHLILGKIIKFVAIRCQILTQKCTKVDFGWDSAPGPTGGAYSAPPDPTAGLRGPTSKERRGEGGRGKCLTSAGGTNGPPENTSSGPVYWTNGLKCY